MFYQNDTGLVFKPFRIYSNTSIFKLFTVLKMWQPITSSISLRRRELESDPKPFTGGTGRNWTERDVDVRAELTALENGMMSQGCKDFSHLSFIAKKIPKALTPLFKTEEDYIFPLMM